jgi:hypothetical protein
MIKKGWVHCRICDRSLLQDRDVLPTPLCGQCFNNLIEFIDKKDPTLATGFAILNLKTLSMRSHSQKTKEGLSRSTKSQGRPVKWDYLKIKQLKYEGNSYSQIKKQLGCSNATIKRALDFHPSIVTNLRKISINNDGIKLTKP